MHFFFSLPLCFVTHSTSLQTALCIYFASFLFSFVFKWSRKLLNTLETSLSHFAVLIFYFFSSKTSTLNTMLPMLLLCAHMVFFLYFSLLLHREDRKRNFLQCAISNAIQSFSYSSVRGLHPSRVAQATHFPHQTRSNGRVSQCIFVRQMCVCVCNSADFKLIKYWIRHRKRKRGRERNLSWSDSKTEGRHTVNAM